jgi:tetratricopeptide (TPR) repeat protein
MITAAWLLICTVPAVGDPLDTAQQHFARRDYQQGVRILKAAAGNTTYPATERQAVLIQLARLFTEAVGDYPRAIRYYRQAMQLAEGSNEGRPLVKAAQAELDRCVALENKYRDVSGAVRQMKAFSFQRGRMGDPDRQRQLAANAERLARILDHNGSYHRRHEVYYALGLTFLALDRPLGAYRAFGKALDAKPAMNLALPITRLHDQTRQQWIRSAGRCTAWILFGLLIGVLAVAGFRSRPWAWVRFRHLAAGLALVVLWIALFHMSHRWSATGDAAARLVNSDGVYPPPVYIHTTLGTPGAEVVDHLFRYGLTAVAGIFFFSVAVGRMRHRWRALAMTTAFAVLFTGSLATLYVLDCCDQKGRYYADGRGAAGLAAGCLAYPMNDPEPYLLVNPLYYQGLELSSIDDPVLVEWLESYVKITDETE